MGRRAEALAARLEQGAEALAAYAEGLTDAEWSMAIPKDGRTVGVIVHHVANMYPLEIQLAQTLASGKPVWERRFKVQERDRARIEVPWPLPKSSTRSIPRRGMSSPTISRTITSSAQSRLRWAHKRHTLCSSTGTARDQTCA